MVRGLGGELGFGVDQAIEPLKVMAGEEEDGAGFADAVEFLEDEVAIVMGNVVDAVEAE